MRAIPQSFEKREHRRPSQQARVIQHMADGRWVCGTVFLADYMPRYSAVIHTLRHRRGFTIEGRSCQQHAHPQVYEFRITHWPKGEQRDWLESAGEIADRRPAVQDRLIP